MKTLVYNHEINGERTMRIYGVASFGVEKFEKTSTKNVKGMCLMYSKRLASYSSSISNIQGIYVESIKDRVKFVHEFLGALETLACWK